MLMGLEYLIWVKLFIRPLLKSASTRFAVNFAPYFVGGCHAKEKTVGVAHTHKLFEKSLTKNFTKNRTVFVRFLQVLVKLFQKFAGCGAGPTVFFFA